MLGYEEFKNELLKETGKILGDRYAVTMSEGRMANLGLVEALEIFDRETPENQLGILYYFGPYFKKYKDGGTLHGIAGEIAESHRKKERHAQEVTEAVKDIADFEKCRGRLYFRMVNTARNREFLENVPHWEMLDLSAVPYILVREDGRAADSIIVDSGMVKRWGVSAEDATGRLWALLEGRGRHMGFLLRWDTPMKTIPAEKAKEVPAGILEKLQEQGQVWSLHPQCPKPVTYVGTKVAGHGFVDDYYVDEQGVYWHESRLPEEPVVLEFIYGGGACTKKHKKRSRTA